MRTVHDPTTIELAQTRIRLRDDLEVTAHDVRGRTYWHLSAPGSSDYFRIAWPEYVFLSFLDGETSFCQALALTARSLREGALSEADATRIYNWLLKQGFGQLQGASESPVRRLRKLTAPGQSAWHQQFNPFWMQVPLGSPERVLRMLEPVGRVVFSAAFLVAAVCLLVAAALQLLTAEDEFLSGAAAVFSIHNGLWLMVSWVGLKTIHETAHGLACLRYGGRVPAAGVAFVLFAPLAWIDASACWAFRSRWQRFVTAGAGVYVELVVASLAVLLWHRTEHAVLQHLLWNVALMASVSTVVFNMNPFMRFDGYFMLSDLVGIPNLNERAAMALRNTVLRFLIGSRTAGPCETGCRRALLPLFALGTLAWRIVVMTTLMMTASVMMHGAGVSLAIAAGLMWYGKPLLSMLRGYADLCRSRPAAAVRCAGLSVLSLGAALALLTMAPMPLAVTAPGIVQYNHGQMVRATTAGFVRAIHIVDGQQVRAGDPLITLKNDDVAQRHHALSELLAMEQLRLQIARRMHDVKGEDVARRNVASLLSQLAETRRAWEGLTLRAERDGTVMLRQPHLLQNTYVDSGCHLLTVADPQSKHFEISLAECDLDEAVALLEQPVTLQIGTRTSVTGILYETRPAASDRLPDPALAATNGGPLDVQEDPDFRKNLSSDGAALRLTEPRIRGVVQLAPASAAEIRCGERGYAKLGRAHDTIASWLSRSVQSWFRATLAELMQQSA